MANTDLTIKFPNKTSRKHFMDWLKLEDTNRRYTGYMDDVEIEDMRTKYLTVLSWCMNVPDGVVTTMLGRLTDLRAVNLS